MKDDVYAYNQKRWESLAKADAVFTRTYLQLNKDSAREYLELDRMGIPHDLTGKNVLCLASGGGQQSAAFALLGANVSVLDLKLLSWRSARKLGALYGYCSAMARICVEVQAD